LVSTHSRAEAAALQKENTTGTRQKFQHTAARRRLLDIAHPELLQQIVSTHSRAEAAAMKELITALKNYGFNTQPRGGGCLAWQESV